MHILLSMHKIMLLIKHFAISCKVVDLRLLYDIVKHVEHNNSKFWGLHNKYNCAIVHDA
jgi:hypothetical protein